MTPVTALGLFSGGLDSILACRVVAEQGVRVKAIKCVTPFFDHDLLAREAEYQQEMKEKYGLDVELLDLSRGYIELLRNPAHGFGKNFNPCIDCKILMLSRARELLVKYGAAFLITGEVLGQRPMSQRRDTLRVIERDSGCEDILLRPLSAKLLLPTLPEREGLVDRDRLYGFTGRSRKDQITLARKLGISEYPSPAGGCMLTDVNLAARIKRFYGGRLFDGLEQINEGDINLLLVGRQFRLPGGIWFVLGRNEQENETLANLREEGDWLMNMPERPGPTGLLRRAGQIFAGSADMEERVRQAVGLVVRFGRKQDGLILPADVEIEKGDGREIVHADPLPDEVFQDWVI